MKKQLLKLCSVIISLLLVFSAVITSDATVFVSEGVSSQTEFPDSVDNSTSKYFPSIQSQGDQGSCVCWGQGYYQFTYMFNRAHDITTTDDNSFSALWLYNLANGGRSSGTWDEDVYGLMKEIGCLRQSDAEFSIKDDQNWYPTEEMWKTAMKHRISSYETLKDIGFDTSQVTSADDTELDAIKERLAQGEVLAATTYIYSWKVGRLKEHPSVPENSKYAEQYVVMYEEGTSVRHRVAIVGYNDNIWTDINGNGNVDKGEMGALKIANSWGTDRHNKGFMWLAYDSLNMTSCVEGAPVLTSYRPGVIHDVTSITVLPFDSDTSMYFRYTLNTADRGQAKMYATATKGDTTYTFELGPKRMHGMAYNNFSYDGTKLSNDGTMVYVLSNLIPDITPETLHEYKWSIKFEDNKADGTAFTVKNFEIVDDTTGRVSKPSGVYPIKLDGTSKEVALPQFAFVEPTTPSVSTQPVSSEITDPVESTTLIPATTKPIEYIYGLVGDSNDSSDISISDATLIQKYVSGLIDDTEILLVLSDCDNDSKVTVKDATCIQKYLAQLADTGITGELVIIGEVITETIVTDSVETTASETVVETLQTDPTEPVSSEVTEPAVSDPTEPSTTENEVVNNTVYFTNSLKWSGTIYCYYWSQSNSSMISWPGEKMEVSSTNTYGETVYMCHIPADADHIIFSNSSTQTVDIPYSGGEKRYYPSGENGGKYEVKEW